MARGTPWIGTSGWSYPNWRGLVYPAATRQRDWLRHYAGMLSTVEVNATFYRLPSPALVEGWRERTPAGFRFAVKAWRAITHMRRLADTDALLARFFERIAPFGDKIGPILFQLPPGLAPDRDLLARFLDGLPAGRRHAFEFRHAGWHDDTVYALLSDRGVAFCPFELGESRSPQVVTADFVYVRLHGRQARYRGAYGEAVLADWAGWLRPLLAEGRDAYVYFDNTDEADHAVRDALRLRQLLVDGEPA